MCILAKLARKVDYNLNFSTVLNMIDHEKVRKPCRITMYLHSKLTFGEHVWVPVALASRTGCSRSHSPNVSTTPITAMGCQQCLPLSVVQLKGKHCRKPHCRNGVLDTLGHKSLCNNPKKTSVLALHAADHLACLYFAAPFIDFHLFYVTSKRA